MKTKMNRRTFLKVSTVAGSGLLVGCSFSSPKILSTPDQEKNDLGLWVRIGSDDTLTLIPTRIRNGSACPNRSSNDSC